jgi:chromosome segregation ATPase
MRPKSNDLMEIIDAAYASHQNDLNKAKDDLRTLEQALAQLEQQHRALAGQYAEAQRIIEAMKGQLAAHPLAQRSRTMDPIEMLRERLAHEEDLNRENENRLRGSAKRIADLEAALEQIRREMEQLKERERELAARDGAIRDAISKLQAPRMFKFVQPGRVDERDIAAVISQRDREAVAEMNAREEEANKAANALKGLENELLNAGKEIERLRKDIATLGQTADSRQQEIGRLQEHLQNQGGVIQKQGQEISEKEKQLEDANRRINALERDLQDAKTQIASAQEEIRNRGNTIDQLQNQVHEANEEVGNKLIALSMILEKLTQARDEFEAKDAEIEALHNTLSQVERDRLEKDAALKQFKADEFAIVDEMSHAGDMMSDRGNNKNVPQTAEEQELNRLFQNARETLGVLGQKASYSYAALKTKDDLDALYDEQLTVTGAEMILRDKKINLLVEKVIIAEKFINDVLRLLGQQNIIKPSTSAEMKFRTDAAPSGTSGARRDISTVNATPVQMPPSSAQKPFTGAVPLPGMQKQTFNSSNSAYDYPKSANRGGNASFDPNQGRR